MKTEIRYCAICKQNMPHDVWTGLHGLYDDSFGKRLLDAIFSLGFSERDRQTVVRCQRCDFEKVIG